MASETKADRTKAILLEGLKIQTNKNFWRI